MKERSRQQRKERARQRELTLQLSVSTPHRAPKRDRSPESSLDASVTPASAHPPAAATSDASDVRFDSDLGNVFRLPGHEGERILIQGISYHCYDFVKLLLLYNNRATREVEVLCGYQLPNPEPDVLGGWCQIQEPTGNALLRHVTAKVSPGVFAGNILLPLLRAHLLMRPQRQGFGYFRERSARVYREFRCYVWALDAASLRHLLDTALVHQVGADWRPLHVLLHTLPLYYRQAASDAALSVFPGLSSEGRFGY